MKGSSIMMLMISSDRRNNVQSWRIKEGKKCTESPNAHTSLQENQCSANDTATKAHKKGISLQFYCSSNVPIACPKSPSRCAGYWSNTTYTTTSHSGSCGW